jgi:hypothetical protein
MIIPSNSSSSKTKQQIAEKNPVNYASNIGCDDHNCCWVGHMRCEIRIWKMMKDKKYNIFVSNITAAVNVRPYRPLTTLSAVIVLHRTDNSGVYTVP